MTRLEYLKEIKTKLPKNPVCAEIGVYRGDFSKMIQDELDPVHITLIDPYEVNQAKKYSDGLATAYSTDKDYSIAVNKTKKKGCLFIQDYSYNVVKSAINGAFDFIYLDGSHLYKDVKQDLNDWFPKLKPTGIIGGHDYGNELFKGVRQAVDEFCEERNLKITLLSNEGDFALQ